VRIDRVRVGITNTYLIRDTGAVLVDSGEPGRAEAVLRRLRRQVGPLPPISLILLTHGHLDHTGNAEALRRETGARIAVHERDAAWLRHGDLAIPPGLTRWGRVLDRSVRGVLPRVFRPSPLEPDVLIGDDGLSLSVYGVAGRVVHTPGHTAGSLSVLLQTGDAIVGDLVMNGLPFCLRPSLAVLGDSRSELAASWKHLLQLGARIVHPGHGRPCGVSTGALRSCDQRNSGSDQDTMRPIE